MDLRWLELARWLIMLKIENLSKKFDTTEALKSVNVHAEKGEIYGLVGTNGSGKTTILKHIMKIKAGDQITYLKKILVC